MQIGIVGAKYTGKTTLFQAVTGLRGGNGGRGQPQRAVAEVPDPRLDRLSELFQPRRTVRAQIEWVDVPGMALGGGALNGPAPDGGAAARAGGGASGGADEAAPAAVRVLEHARRVDALVQVVRCFEDGIGPAAPASELDDFAAELVLADLQVVENRLERLAKERQKGVQSGAAVELAVLERARAWLEEGRPLRELDYTAEQRRAVAGFSFLSLKPLIVVLNGPEGGVSPELVAAARARGQLPAEDRGEFLEHLGIGEPALGRMIRAAYGALGLQSFFTVGEDECRAWTVRQRALAPEAAGVIHSDLERGFIRAEVCAYETLVAAGSLGAAKKANQVRLEGKGYEVQDGDVVSIRFSV
jgi:hypothetical protein